MSLTMPKLMGFKKNSEVNPGEMVFEGPWDYSLHPFDFDALSEDEFIAGTAWGHRMVLKFLWDKHGKDYLPFKGVAMRFRRKGYYKKYET